MALLGRGRFIGRLCEQQARASCCQPSHAGAAGCWVRTWVRGPGLAKGGLARHNAGVRMDAAGWSCAVCVHACVRACACAKKDRPTIDRLQAVGKPRRQHEHESCACVHPCVRVLLTRECRWQTGGRSCVCSPPPPPPTITSPPKRAGQPSHHRRHCIATLRLPESASWLPPVPLYSCNAYQPRTHRRTAGAAAGRGAGGIEHGRSCASSSGWLTPYCSAASAGFRSGWARAAHACRA